MPQKNGHLDIIKWAVQNKCSCDKWTCVWAAQHEQFEVVRWWRQNGCVWDNSNMIEYKYKQSHPTRHYSALKWLHNHDEFYSSSGILNWFSSIETTLDELLIPELCNLIKEYI